MTKPTAIEKLLRELEEAGCKDWKSITDWAKNHEKSYRRFLHLDQHQQIAKALGLGIKILDKSLNQQKIKDFYSENKRLPKQHSRIKEENNLAYLLSSYCRESHGSFDYLFCEWAKSVGYGMDTKNQKQEQIKLFYQKNQKFPKNNSQDLAEKRLGEALNNYLSRKNNKRDQDFITWVRSNGYGFNTTAIKKQKIKDFYHKNDRLPSKHSKITEEMRLGEAVFRYSRLGDRCYDPEFDAWARSVGYGQKKKDKK